MKVRLAVHPEGSHPSDQAQQGRNEAPATPEAVRDEVRASGEAVIEALEEHRAVMRRALDELFAGDNPPTDAPPN